MRGNQKNIKNTSDNDSTFLYLFQGKRDERMLTSREPIYKVRSYASIQRSFWITSPEWLKPSSFVSKKTYKKTYRKHYYLMTKKRSIVLHSQKSWRCRFFLRKHNKKTGRKHLFLSMSKNTKKCQKCPLPKGVQYVNVQCSGPRLNYGSIRWTIHKFSRHNASIIHCSYEFSPCSTLSPLSACSIRKATGNPPC